jgi:hypothetical protein
MMMMFFGFAAENPAIGINGDAFADVKEGLELPACCLCSICMRTHLFINDSARPSSSPVSALARV